MQQSPGTAIQLAFQICAHARCPNGTVWLGLLKMIFRVSWAEVFWSMSNCNPNTSQVCQDGWGRRGRLWRLQSITSTHQTLRLGGKGGVKRHAFGLRINMVVLTTSPLFVDINRLKWELIALYPNHSIIHSLLSKRVWKSCERWVIVSRNGYRAGTTIELFWFLEAS